MRPSRRPTPTPALRDAQAALNRLRADWNAQTDTQKRYFQQLALQISANNALSNRITPTPFSAFCHYYAFTHLYNPGGAWHLPTARITDQPTSIDLGFTATNLYMIRIVHPYGLSNVWCGIYAAPIYSTSVPASLPPLRFITAIQNLSYFTNIYANWTAKLPDLRQWQHFAVQVVCLADYYFPSTPALETSYYN